MNAFHLQEVARNHEAGNEAFRNQLYQNAKVLYLKALDIICLLNGSCRNPGIMSEVKEREKKLLSNLSKAVRLLGQDKEAIAIGVQCVRRYPAYAKGHFCLAEAYRDSLPPPPFEMPPDLAVQTITNCLTHFAEAFRLSNDKLAFYECVLMAIPAGFTAILPHVHEPHKKTVFQYSADVLIQNQRTPLLQAYLQFFLIPNPGFVDYGQEVLPGCAIGYVNFQHLNLFSEIYYLIDLTMINALINHGMPVDVNVLLKILNGDAPHKRQLVEAFFPVLPQCKVDSTETKKILNACIPGRHYDVMVYLHTQGVHFPSDVVAHIMKQQGKFTSLMQLKSLLSTSVDEHLKCAVKLREEGTAAYKEQDYLNARRCYRQALDKLSQAPAGVVKYTLLEERQKLLGNLSSVERHLKNYDGSISWAKSLVKNFPDNPKGHFRIAEAYRDQSYVKKGDEMHKLQICAIESFGKAFEMSRESQSYFECFYLAVLADSLHLVPAVEPSEKIPVGKFVFECLLKKKKEQEYAAHFINTMLKLPANKQKNLAYPFLREIIRETPLSELPTLRLTIDTLKLLVNSGMKVDFSTFQTHLLKGKEEACVYLLGKLQQSDMSPRSMSESLTVAVHRQSSTIVEHLLQKGAQFSQDMRIRIAVLEWDIRVLSTSIIKAALKGDVRDISREQVTKILKKRLQYLEEKSTKEYESKSYSAARASVVEAIDCYDGIETMEDAKTTLFLKKKLQLFSFLSSIECDAGNLADAKSYAAKCISVDPEFVEGLFSMANVYNAEARLEQGRTAKAMQLKEHAFRLYLRAFNAKCDRKEFFAPMFVLAVSEGIEYTMQLPKLTYLKKSTVNELLQYTVKYLLDKSQEHPLKLVRSCLVFILVPKRDGPGYGQGLVKLTPFSLSQFMPYVGFNQVAIECLVKHGVTVDSAAIVLGIKELYTTRESEMPGKRSLLLKLIDHCHSNNTKEYLTAAIAVKDRELVEHLISVKKARIDDGNMKSMLSWNASYLLPSLIEIIVQSESPPLHIKNAKNQTIVDIARMYRMPHCVHQAMLKSKGVSEKPLNLSIAEALSNKPSVEMLQSLIDSGAEVSLRALEALHEARKRGTVYYPDCQEMTKMICRFLPKDVLVSVDCRKLLSRCISDNFREMVEILLEEGVSVTESDACRILSWKAKNISVPILAALVKSDMKTTAKVSTINLMLQTVLKMETFELLNDIVPLCSAISPLYLSSIVKCPDISLETLSLMVDKGASLGSSDTAPSALVQLKKILKDFDVKRGPRDILQKHCLAFILLVEKGADISGLIEQEPNSPTPIHVATSLALHTGHADILKVVLRNFISQGSQLLNALGQTPLHEVAKHRSKPTDAVMDLLLEAGVDPKAKDKKKMTALDLCRGKGGKERTFDKLTEYQKRYEDLKRDARINKKKKKKKAAVESQKAPVESQNPTSQTHDKGIADSETLSNAPETRSSIINRQENLTLLVKNSLDVLRQFGIKEPEVLSKQLKDNTIEQDVEEDSGSEAADEDSDDADLDVVAKDENSHQMPVEILPPTYTVVSQQDFDGLTWEVDCTERFWKNLAKLPEFLRKKAVTNIQRLASGEWHAKFHKAVGNEPDLDLFEMKLTKGRRILWQKAIDFSPRCSTDSNRVVYSEIIRLWDLVKHKGIQSSIDYIEQSFRKGRDSHVKFLLQHLQSKSSPTHQVSIMRECVPKLFVCSSEHQNSGTQYAPAATPGELDYNVITFYAFSSNLVHNILSRVGERYDFPFKGWPKEHDIINLDAGEPILLLGRSGTGKTTCCVYRLWNQCSSYWNKAVEPYVPRVPLLFTKSTVQTNENYKCEVEDNVHENNSSTTAQSTGDTSTVGKSYGDNVMLIERSTVEHEEWYGGWQEQVSAVPESSDSGNVDIRESMNVVVEDETPLDHLQQIFITKNPVLVSQVQKKFYDLASSSNHMSEHLKFESQPFPVRFQDVPPLAYPLFVTSFQWLNLVDASLASGQSLFPRDDNGKLLVELVDSAGEFSTNVDDIELYDDSEQDSVEDEDDVFSHAIGEDATTSQRQRVVDSSYFIDFIWQQITKTHVILRKKYEPLLVWMEIRSFLKGSYEALMVEDGGLSLQEYKSIGAKRAANFTGDRDEIYKLFKLYQKYLSQHSLVDQCDWVHHIFWRLKQQEDVHIVLHEIYIDEVQDFTQAELYLILHCCRFPNGLFLTGDTAQSIMRGVSFRFQDLRSLFHHFRETYLKDRAKRILNIPDMHELTQNFRSHSGILEVASTVIKLLQLFFPNSFDTLPEDRGLFSGPKPIILHSVSESNLAIILRGNRREASTIEFGAHQAILVQTEDAKRSLPNELSGAIVLTVFEAKGLEFDDVLLYNFFTDSKADHEWRLALEHLVENGVNISGTEFPFLDKSVLRPLEFDEKVHRSFSAELKYLYTAITRAKCNLWIYDATPAKFTPLVYVLLKLGLVSAISLSDISEEEVTTVFVKESSAEEWMKRGNYFMKKKLWDPANKCFLKCGNKVLAMEAEALGLISKARKISGQPKIRRQHCIDAACLFLKCASSPDTILHKYLKNAATCLYTGQQWELAAQIFEGIKEWSKAFKSYHQAKCYLKASAMKEQQGQFSESIQYLSTAGSYPLALKTALRYQRQNIVIENPNLSVEELANQTAKHHIRRAEYDQMFECVQLLPDISDKIRILKIAGEYERAVTLLVEADRTKEAYDILASKNRFEEGLKLAEAKNDGSEALNFLLMRARSLEVVKTAVRNIKDGNYFKLTDEERAERLDDLREKLLGLLGDMTRVIEKWHLQHKCPLRVLEKRLLEGVCHLDGTKLKDFNRSIHNSFARMDQLCLLCNLTSPDSHLATDLVGKLLVESEELALKIPLLMKLKEPAILASKDLAELASELEDWYGLRSSLESFSIIPGQDLWVSFPQKTLKVSMAVFNKSVAIDRIQKDVYSAIKLWLEFCDPIIARSLKAERFYKCHGVCSNLSLSIHIEHGLLAEFLEALCFAVLKDIALISTHLSCLAFYDNTEKAVLSIVELLSDEDVRIVVKNYRAKSRDHLLNLLKTRCSGEEGWRDALKLFPVTYSKLGTSSGKTLLQYFSPILAYHIPLSGKHYRILCRYPSVHDYVLSYDNRVSKASTDVNAFMTAWWMRGSEKLQPHLDQCVKAKNFSQDLVVGDRSSNVKKHCFALWIVACSQKKHPLKFCQIALHRFCRVIIQRREVKKFNPTHMLPLLELLSTTLIALLVCQEDRLRHQYSGFMACLPMKYDHVVQLFGDCSWTVGTRRGENHLLKNVYNSVQEDGNVLRMHEKTRTVLLEVADIFFGVSGFKGFKVLEYVLKSADNVSNGLLQRSIALSLVLLANLEFYAAERCLVYREAFLGALSSALQQLKQAQPQQNAQIQKLFTDICAHSHAAVGMATSTKEFITFLASFCKPNDMAVLQVDHRRWCVQFYSLKPEVYKSIHFSNASSFQINHPTTSPSDSTPWPDWEEGEAIYPTVLPQNSSYGMESPIDDVSFDDEEEVTVLEGNDSDIKLRMDRYFNREVCVACGTVVEAIREEDNFDAFVEHLDSALHTSNQVWFDRFEERKLSGNSVLNEGKNVLQQSSQIPDKSLIMDRLEEGLRQGIGRLQKLQTSLPPGVRTQETWSQLCGQYEKETADVRKLTAELKGMIPYTKTLPQHQSQSHSGTFTGQSSSSMLSDEEFGEIEDSNTHDEIHHSIKTRKRKNKKK